MSGIAAEGPNAQQIEYWNEVSGPKWVEMSATIDAQIAPLGSAAMDVAQIRPGECVIDVGCGCGETTIELARRVGVSGRVLGVDLSAVMLERARERAEQAGLANVDFENADAQTHAVGDAEFDVLFSRFGVMFFAEPEVAFRNLLRALRPGGRFVFVAWQGLPKNPWMSVPVSAVARHLTLPPPGEPDAPGPFAFADAQRVSGILSAAGFTDIAHQPLEQELLVAGGKTLDDTVEFLLQLGPAGALLREANPALRGDVAKEIRTAIEPFQDATGTRMPAAAWIFSARRSD